MKTCSIYSLKLNMTSQSLSIFCMEVQAVAVGLVMIVTSFLCLKGTSGQKKVELKLKSAKNAKKTSHHRPQCAK